MNENPPIPRIYIAIPTRDPNFSQICGKLFLLLVELVKNPAFSVTIDIVAGDPVDRGRNLICQKFLSSDAEYLLMLDDDVVPPPHVLEMAQQDKDVIGGLYYAYLPGPGYYSIAYTSDTPPETGTVRSRLGIGRDIENTGIIEVALLATGCMMIHRRVLEGCKEPFFQMEMDETVRWITESEDFSFCKKARKAGFRVWLDTGVTCRHIKSLDMQESIHWAQEYSRRQSMITFLRVPPVK